MANARSILSEKGTAVVSAEPNTTVLAAARLMNDHRLGSVLVITGGRLVGIFTERDILQRVVAEQRDPAQTAVAQVMTSPVCVGSPTTSTDELRTVFREKRIRHLPILDGDRVVGVISIGDVNRALSRVQEETIQYLEQYISVP